MDDNKCKDCPNRGNTYQYLKGYQDCKNEMMNRVGKFEQVIADAEELQRKIRHWRWLEEIKQEYESMIKMIDHEKDYFTIRSFTYTTRGDARSFPANDTYTSKFQINPHRSIPYTFIRDGLKAELETICQEIEDCKREIEQS